MTRLLGPAPAPPPDVRSAAMIAALLARAEAHEAAAGRATTLLESVPRPLWRWDAGGRITWCNVAYAHAVGLDPEEVVESQRNLVPWSLEPPPAAERMTIVTGGKRRVMAVMQTPLPTPPGGRLGLALDVTREDEMERAARRNQAVYRDLLESLRSAIAIYDAGQNLEFYNTAFAQLWGLPERWLDTAPTLGAVMDRLRETRRLPEQVDFGRFKAAWLGMFTDLIESHDDMLHLPDGSSLRLMVIPNPMGGLMMIFEDVTSRLALESSYNTLVAVQRETLEALAEGVAVFGGDGRLRLYNPAFARAWGLAPEGLEGGPHITQMAERMAQRLPLGAREAGHARLRALALERAEHKGTFLCATMGEGQVVHLAYASLPLPDGGVMVTFRDVTDAARAAQALEDKARALEAAEDLKADFLANVSYQLRTPLNTMTGFAEILAQEYFGPLNDKQKEYTQGMLGAGAELLCLIDDILDLSTIEAGYMELHPQVVDVRGLLDGLEGLVAGWATARQARVRVDCARDVGPAWCDVQRVRQALLNLARNALAYTPKGGEVVLAARPVRREDPHAGGVRLLVADGGPGIAPQDRVRIFKPFERAAERRGGAGLGLTLVKSIVELHGGRVDLVSKPGHGTTVSIVLPPRAKATAGPPKDGRRAARA